MIGDLLKTVDGVESDSFNFIVKHVHEEILRQVSKTSGLLG